MQHFRVVPKLQHPIAHLHQPASFQVQYQAPVWFFLDRLTGVPPALADELGFVHAEPDRYLFCISSGVKLEAARTEGAKAERERIQNIETIKVPGAQAVIEKMKFDPKATKETVAVAVLEEQQKKAETTASQIGKDAQALAGQVGKVVTGQEEGTDTNASAEEQAALEAMVSGINNK